MYLLEELDKIMRGLYQDFLAKRMDPDWTSQELPKLHAWISAQGEYENTSLPSGGAQNDFSGKGGSADQSGSRTAFAVDISF